MKFVDSFKRGFVLGYTQGYAELSIAEVELERDTAAQRPTVLVRVHCKVHSWDGRRVRVHTVVRDAQTREQLGWANGTTLSDEPVMLDTGCVTLRVSLTAAATCYAQVTLFNDADPIAEGTSAVLEIPASSARSANSPGAALAATPPPPASPDHELLGLRAGCSVRELKAAYKRAIAEWHPDRFAHSSDALRTVAAEQTRSIIAAYERLRKERAA